MLPSQSHSTQRHAKDLALAREACAGSKSAQRRLAHRLQCLPRVLAALNRRRGSPLGQEDLEDATQDVATALWRRLDSYDGRSALESWAFGFCQNVLSERVRARARRPPQVSSEAAPEPAAAEDPTDAPSEAATEALYAAFDGARPSEPLALVREKHFEGKSFQELGEAHGITANAAKKRYYKGLDKLRILLGPLRRRGEL